MRALLTLLCIYCLLSALSVSANDRENTQHDTAQHETVLHGTVLHDTVIKPYRYVAQFLSPEQLRHTVDHLYAEKIQFVDNGKQIYWRSNATEAQEIRRLLEELDHPPQRFTLSLARMPKLNKQKIYATNRRGLSQSFSLTEGQPLVLSAISHVQTVGVSEHWMQVYNLPTEGEVLRLQVSTTAQQAYITIDWQRLRDGQQQSTQTTLSATFDEWTPLGAIGNENPGQTVTRSTNSRGLTGWQVRLSPVQ